MLVDPNKAPAGVLPPTLVEQGSIAVPQGTEYAIEVWRSSAGTLFAFVSNNYGGLSIANSGEELSEVILDQWPGSTIITHWIRGKQPQSIINSNGHCFGLLQANGDDLPIAPNEFAGDGFDLS